MPVTMSWYGNPPHAPMNSMRQQGGGFQKQGPPPQRMMGGSHMHMPGSNRSFQRDPPLSRGHPYPVTFHQREGMLPPQGHPYPMMNRGPADHAPYPGMMRSSPPRGFAGPPMSPHYGAVPRHFPGGPPPYMHVSSGPCYGEVPPPVHLRTHFAPMERPVPPRTNLSKGPRPQHGASPNLSPPSRSPSPPPLRESLVHNVRQSSSPAEEARKQESDTTKSENLQNGMQDAALALISMNAIIEQSEASLKAKHNSTYEAPREAKTFPTRLALDEDKEKLNSMHCFLRAELLELFLVEKSSSPHILSENNNYTSSDTKAEEEANAPSRVGLRCVHCAQARKIYGQDCEAPMACFYPKSIAELYRLVTSWQRVHLRKCRNLPKPVRETYTDLRQNDKSRGKTHYWVTSAKKIGLIDNPARAGGIVFSPYSD